MRSASFAKDVWFKCRCVVGRMMRSYKWTLLYRIRSTCSEIRGTAMRYHPKFSSVYKNSESLVL